jgi:hypothetical protein
MAAKTKTSTGGGARCALGRWALGPVRAASAVLLAGAGAAMLAAGGCVQRGFAVVPGEGDGVMGPWGERRPRPDGGAWSEAVFDAPAAGSYLAAVGGSEVLPEYVRRDAALGVAVSGTILATDQWPVPGQPELSETRYLWLPGRGWYGGQLIAYRRR